MSLTQKQVSELYVAIFNRASEGEGNKFWQQPADAKAAANSMLDTQDAKAYFGTSLDSNQAFIEHIYSNTLNKTYAQDKAGIDFWVNALNSGMSRGEVVASLVAAVANYSSSTDPVTKAAYDQFNNRVEVSNYMANTVEKAPADYATSTKFATSGTTGLVVTNSASTVTTAKNSVQALTIDGKTFTLTANSAAPYDSIAGTSKNDLFTAASGTLQTGDIIVDGSTTDNDTLNVTVSTSADMGAKATISGVENINVNIDAFAGTAATFDATNVQGATITLSSSKLGFDGEAGVLAAGANNVTAGANITALTVTGVTTGVVDAGSAATVTVDAAAATNNLALTVNGNVTADLGNTIAFDKAAITATADSVVSLAAGTVITTSTDILGSGNVTLKGAAAELTTKTITNSGTGTLSVNLTDDASADFSKIATTNVTVADKYGTAATTLKVANGSTINAAGTLVGTVAYSVAGTDTTRELTFDVAGASVGALVLTDLTKTTINVNQDTAIGALVATGDTVVITGADDVTFAAAADAAVVDASALAGKLVYSTASAKTQTVKGGKDKATLTTSTDDITTFVGQDAGNTINALTTTGTLSVQTGSGVDSLIVTALTNGGKIVGNLGAGNDTVTFSTNLGTSQLNIDGGTGTADTIVLKNGSDLGTISALSTVTGFENITYDSSNNAATIAALIVSGKTIKVTGTTGNDSLTIKGLASTAQTIDLSNITFDAVKAIETVSVTGSDKADVIKGFSGVTGISTSYTIDAGKGDDTIIVGASSTNSTITGGEGNDTIDLTGATGVNTIKFDAAATNGLDTIKGWGAADVINVKALGGTIVGENTISVAAAATTELATAQALIFNTNGTAANLLTGGTATVTDWTDLADVAAYLSERVEVAASKTGVFIINDTTTGANKTYIYDVKASATVNTTIEAGELTLVGTIDNGGVALSIANVDFA